VDDDECLHLRAIGAVRSELRDPADAPRQGDEGAPHAQLVLAPDVVPGLDGLQVGDELLVLTWLHLARRDVLHTRPRNDPARPEQGVFTTRSPDRPNPIGLHRVRVGAPLGRHRGRRARGGRRHSCPRPETGARRRRGAVIGSHGIR
jgi:tRNA (Thr-GGU) A37 N-methylase